jgi:serpin B
LGREYWEHLKFRLRCDYYLNHGYYVTGVLNDLTRLVLVNAVYFKGLWQNKFRASDTVQDLFHLSSTESKEVPMMRQTDDFGYMTSQELDADILEMPYKVGLSYGC